MKPKLKKIILLAIIIGIVVFTGIQIKETYYYYIEDVKSPSEKGAIPIFTPETRYHMKGYSKIIDYGLVAFVGIILCVIGIYTITQNEQKKAMTDNRNDNTKGSSDYNDNSQHIRGS